MSIAGYRKSMLFKAFNLESSVLCLYILETMDNLVQNYPMAWNFAKQARLSWIPPRADIDNAHCF